MIKHIRNLFRVDRSNALEALRNRYPRSLLRRLSVRCVQCLVIQTCLYLKHTCASKVLKLSSPPGLACTGRRRRRIRTGKKKKAEGRRYKRDCRSGKGERGMQKEEGRRKKEGRRRTSSTSALSQPQPEGWGNIERAKKT